MSLVQRLSQEVTSSITVDDTGNTITFATDGSVDVEVIQDAVADLLVGGTG
jgi:hypothetical protein